MEQGLLHLHNFLRWILIILLLVNIFRHLAAMNKPYIAADKKLGLWLMIAAHIQLVIGIYQYFTSDTVGFVLVEQMEGMGNVMKNSFARFWVVEHPLGTLISIILITLGKGVARKNISDTAKHKRALILFVLALVIAAAVVPWPFREAIARPWFPGMSL